MAPIPKPHALILILVYDRNRRYRREVCADFKTDLAEFNGEVNHIHLLVNSPPKAAPSTLVNSLKGTSPRPLRQDSPN